MRRVLVLSALLFLLLAWGACDEGGGGESDDDAASSDDDDAADDDNALADDDLTDDDTSADDDAADDDTLTEPDWWDLDLAPAPSDEIGIFVAVDPVGDDANPGTMAQPVRTIQRALELAEGTDRVLFVARGGYPGPVLALTTSLYGGYLETTWARNPALYETVVPSYIPTPAITVPLVSGAEKTIDIEGVTIANRYEEGMSIALLVLGGNVNVRLRRNHIESASTTAGVAGVVDSLAVQFLAPAKQTVLTRNVIQSGNVYGAPVHTQAAYILGPATVIGNEFYSGYSHGYSSTDATKALSVRNESQSPSLIANNICVAHSWWTSDNSDALLVSGDSVIVHNTILSDAGLYGAGLHLENGQHVVVNNIIGTRGGDHPAAVKLSAPNQSSVTLVNNNLWAIEDAFVRLPLGVVRTLEAVNDCEWDGCAEAQGNLIVDPQFNIFKYHLSAVSPCIDSGADPALWIDGNAWLLDLDGQTRPQGAGWDIGADEREPGR